jgi:hypothetical protein
MTSAAHSIRILGLLAALALILGGDVAAQSKAAGRRPVSEEDLWFWLENMFIDHGFTTAEAAAATGMSEQEIEQAARRLTIEPAKGRQRAVGNRLLVLPYPGGRHPRIGFLDGAVNPQRETKVSIFPPWEGAGYAVADIPEAIWHETPAGRKLLYLAHTHVPTIWDERKINLEPLEWERTNDGWQIERTLPNKVVFGTRVRTTPSEVRMEMWLTNGTAETLRGLVVQNCVLLKGLPGFDQQTNDNKRIERPYVACHNAEKNRWIITAWEPCHRPWANPPCPCLHSDPKLPDCEPGQTVRVHGWLSFYEGKEIEQELGRLAGLKWDRDR